MSRLSKIYKIFGWIIMIAGVIASLLLAINSATAVGYFKSEFNFGTFLLVFVVGSLISAFSSIFAFTMGEILERLATIDYNLYTIASNKSLIAANESARNDEMMGSGGWRCSQCGKVNPSYTGTCACGNQKPHM